MYLPTTKGDKVKHLLVGSRSSPAPWTSSLLFLDLFPLPHFKPPHNFPASVSSSTPRAVSNLKGPEATTVNLRKLKESHLGSPWSSDMTDPESLVVHFLEWYEEGAMS